MGNFKFDHYYRFDELTGFLKEMAAAYSGIAELQSCGKSPEGRDLWAMIITDKDTGHHLTKPGFYIDGNHHAGEVTGSMIALYIIKQLLEGYGEDSRLTGLIRRCTFYVLPRVSPDGAETYLTTPWTLRSVPRPYPFPNPEEKEGLHPADVDGDGNILMMRVKDYTGEWKTSLKDPRLMVRRAPDEEEGVFYRVYTEGFLREHRGGEIKSAPPKWGLDLNRNFPYAWALDSKQFGAGPFPLSEPETRACAEFVVSHPNISLAFTYHTTGGVILRVPGSHPASKSPSRDIQALIAIGEMGTEETGYPCIPCFEEFSGGGDNYSRGAFDDWLYEHRGILAYTVETWNLSQRAGISQGTGRRQRSFEEEEEEAVRFLAWNDRELGGKGFEKWRPFKHPQMGEVEIGGWYPKFVLQNAPLMFLQGECHKNAAFALRAACTLPRMEVGDVTQRVLGEGVYEVSATVRNTGYLPTFGSYLARENKMVEPLQAEILGEGIEVVGPSKTDIDHLEGRAGFGRIMGMRSPGSSGTRQSCVRWIIAGKRGAKVNIVVRGKRAGVCEATAILE